MVLDFILETSERNQVPLIKIKGEVDVYNAGQLKTALLDLISKNYKLLILNLENVQYIDSTGLGTIAQAAHSISQQNGKIHVVCTRPSIKKIFEVSGLIKKNIVLFDTEELAG